MPDLDCLVCYQTACRVEPNCMESISVLEVYEAVLRQMRKSNKARFNV